MNKALAALALAAALTDIHSRRIPNWLVAAGFAAGVGFQVHARGLPGLWDALLGAAAGFLVYLGLFALRAMGGGDVKLMGAIGAFTGPKDWFVIFVLASLIGGALALVSLATKGGLVRAARNTLGAGGRDCGIGGTGGRGADGAVQGDLWIGPAERGADLGER